jgi:hypothetical protein
VKDLLHAYETQRNGLFIAAWPREIQKKKKTNEREVRFLGINPPALRCIFSSPAAMAAPHHALRMLKKLTEEQNQMKARMLIDTKLLFPDRLIHEIEHFPTNDLPKNKRKQGDDLKGPLLQKMKTVNAQRLEVRGSFQARCHQYLQL